MKIIGNEQEIKWVMEALKNNCEGCPYGETCERAAKEDYRASGKVNHTCREFLGDKIEFVIENNM